MKQLIFLHRNNKELVIQDNELIESPRNLTLQEQKLFLFIISKISNLEIDERTICRIKVDEFAKAIEINHSSDPYRDIRKIVKSLQQRVVTLYSIKNGHETITDITIVTYAKYAINEGYAEIQLNPKLFPYLIGLQNRFTQYELSNVSSLSSSYAIRIYELLKQYEMIGKRAFSIDDIRKKLKIDDDTYKKFSDFRIRVIEIATREINEKTDIKVSYKFRKTGRQITDVYFTIKSNSTIKEYKNETSKVIQLIEDTDIPTQSKKVDRKRKKRSMLNTVTTKEQIKSIKAEKSTLKAGLVKFFKKLFS